MNPTRLTLVSIGEALYDVFPDHRQLGGAPLNLALGLDQLIRPHGGKTLLVARVGQDDAGRELIDELTRRGLSVEYVQTDPDKPTGQVLVSFDDAGQPRYEVVRDAAWDVMQFDPDLEDLARHCDAVAFGTLAQRDAQSRNTIFRFLDAARRAVKLVDVNLRADYFDRRLLERTFEHVTIVKLNHEELPRVADELGIVSGGLDAAAQKLRERFGLEMVVLTRGAEGVRLYHDGGTTDGAPAEADTSQGDAVGAGDACMAGLMAARVLRRSRQQIADLANRCGAFAVSRRGGNPVFPEELIASF